MAGRLHLAAAALLLVGPTVVAFLSGGFFDGPRLWAGLVAWILVGAALLTRHPLPQARSARLALAGCAALGLLTGLSILWAPSMGRAADDLERIALYLGALTAGAAFLRAPLDRLVEPVLAAGIVVVIGYGLSERFLPGLVQLDASGAAAGRLEQPLTYWNATGALATMGLLLCVRMSGDPSRRYLLRGAATGLSVPLALGAYLSFSRAALAGVAAGLVLLVLLAPARSQLRSVGLCLAAGLGAALTVTWLPWVRGLEGDASAAQGAAALTVTLALGAAAGWARVVLARREDAGQLAERPLPRASRALAAGLSVLVLTGAVLAIVTADRGARTRSPAVGAQPERLASLDSRRYSYWRVAIAGFADNPLVGVGSGGFLPEWRRERDIAEGARDAHSLYVETALELGVAGLAALAVFMGGLALSARRALAGGLRAAPGLAAVLAAWALQSGLDWLWEMPGVTLPALVAAATLLAGAEAAHGGSGGASSRSRRAASDEPSESNGPSANDSRSQASAF